MPNDQSKPKPQKPKATPSPAKPSSPSKTAEALASIQNELAAVSPAEFVTINVAIPEAVSLVLGLLPHLRELRPQILEQLPKFPIAKLDSLETYALALLHAHVLWLPPETSEDRVAALLEEAGPLRLRLLSDARALANRGKLDDEAVTTIEKGNGNLDKANDLIALAALFSANWDDIKDKTAATEEEIAQAGELGPKLLAALGAREHHVRLAPDALVDQRRRAYTVFFKAYDEVRRVVGFLRWHEGDADALAPSLFKGRGGRPSSDKGAGDAPKDPQGSPSGGAPGGG